MAEYQSLAGGSGIKSNQTKDRIEKAVMALEFPYEFYRFQ